MKTKIILLMLLTSLTYSGSGVKNKYSAMYKKCINEAEYMNNGVIYECAGNANTPATSEISILYNDVLTILKNNEEGIAKFKASHNAWMLYRDTQCDLEGYVIGSPMYAICPIYINERRISELKALANEASY